MFLASLTRINPMLLMLGFMVWSVAGMAEQAERFGPYIAHYNTFNTPSLTPEVARAYNITRSGNLALINVAILKVGDEQAMDQPKHANVVVQASNLAGQRKNINMIEIEDQGAIYYIGTFPIRNEERINFNVAITPKEDPRRTHRFTFNQVFYVDK